MGEDGELERIAAVRRLEIIGSPPEERFDRITRLARELFDVPVAEINFLDDEVQFTKSPFTEGSSQYTPRPDSFCDVTVQQADVLVVPDATRDERFAHRVTVTGPRHVRFYAGRPIALDTAERVGTLCLVDTEPRDFTAEQARLLDEMGSWVERELQATAELDRAVLVQRALLPPSEGAWPGYDVAALNVAARGVGGDFYTWHADEDHFDLLVADVMGKGTAGAIMAATVRAAAHAHRGAEPAALLSAVEAQLVDDFERTGTFATAFAARIELATGRIAYADAGHGLTVVSGPTDATGDDGGVRRLAATGLPLGVSVGAGWRQEEIELPHGGMLVSVTDGALDIAGGTLDALDEVVRTVSGADGARTGAEALAARAEGLLDDDLTAVVVERRRA